MVAIVSRKLGWRAAGLNRAGGTAGCFPYENPAARRAIILLALGAMLCGCRGQAPPVPPRPVEVLVTLPVSRYVTDYEDFTGRTDAIDSVEIRARVGGYLDKINFLDGAIVKKGQVLFEIDPRPYQAMLNQAEAKVRMNEIELKYQEADFDRKAQLLQRNAVSRDEYEKSLMARDSVQASLKSAKAEVERRKLDLEFTKVQAPVNGRISRRYVTQGNLVVADQTLLTTLVSENPIYAYFDVDERTLLRVRRLIQEGKVESAAGNEVPVLMGLADEEGFPHEGKVDFVDNKVDASTGTLRIRGVFANPKNLISPGMFVRIRLRVGQAHQAILVPERALGADQGQKFLYVVNDKDEIVYRSVKVGAIHDGQRVIEKGLAAGEKVVVNGLQRVRPGVPVSPKMVEPAVPPEAPVAARKGA